MNRLLAYQNSLWLADGERFQRHIQAALLKPCPTSAQVRERHRELLQLAKDLPALAVHGNGVDDPVEALIAKRATDPNARIWVPETFTEAQAKAMDDEVKNVRAESPRAIRATKGKVGVIPIYGPVDQRMSSELEKAGGTPLDFVSAALDALLGNSAVGCVVLRFDSPGGGVAGVEELANKIYQARAQKPIFAHADSMAASASFWLASAASMVITSPGGEVGSVGVYVMHLDESAAIEKDGYKVTLVHAGKHKVEFSTYVPLSPDARAEAQARVNLIYTKFTGALSRNFGLPISHVRDNFGEGRMVDSEKALAAGMVHRIMSFEELMTKLTGGNQQAPAARGPSAEALRLRHEQRKRCVHENNKS